MRTVAFSLFLLLAAVCAPVIGQTAPLEEKQKAVLAFEVRVDLVKDGELGKALDLGKMMSSLPNMDGMDMSKLKKVIGAMSAPENMDAAQGIAAGGPTPEFFVQVHLEENEVCEMAKKKVEEDNGGTVKHDGKTFYKSPEGDGPPMLVHFPKSGLMEAGTEAYLFQDNRKVMTDGLMKAWTASSSEESIRIVADLDAAKGFIGEAVAMAKESADPTTGEFLNLVDNMKDLSITLDVANSKNLLNLTATGVNSEEAEELHSGLDGILGMAKFGGNMQVQAMKEQDPEGAAVMGSILESLNAKLDGEQVKLVVPKPDGFNAFLKKSIEQAMTMMGPSFGP